MKTYIQFILIFVALALQLPLIFGQCGVVVNNTFSASYVEDPIGTCTWNITFDVCNHSQSGNSSLKYSLVADDLDYGILETINPLDEICDVCNIIFPGKTITNTYTGSCEVIFYLKWKGYANPECQGSHVCASGSETTTSPLPVELTMFTGVSKNGMVELRWMTESEENNSHFEIQRSEDGKSFRNIGMVEGQGTNTITNNYAFVDWKALPFAYYRLKQVDYNGDFKFSDIISVKRDDFKTKLIAYPTQAFDEVTIRIESLDTRKSFFKIANISGQVIYKETYYSTNDTEYLTLDIKDYPVGIYFVSLSNKVNTVSTKFVVVNK